jgi:hypothetical protein
MPKASVPPPPVDPDAQAFITATGISGIEATAINQLVLDLKSASIWTKMKAVYPIVGGTAVTHKFNLINPLDSNAAFRLTFTGGWTHSATGMLPNGINAYATTYIVPATHLLPASKHLSYYSRTNATTTGFSSSIGSDNGSTGFCRFTIRQTASNNRSAVFGGTNGTTPVTTEIDSRGFYTSNRSSSTTAEFYKNGSNISIGNATNGTTSQISQALYIGAALSGGTIAYYDNKECAFASIGDSLTNTDALNYYNIVQAFQQALGRDV